LNEWKKTKGKKTAFSNRLIAMFIEFNVAYELRLRAEIARSLPNGWLVLPTATFAASFAYPVTFGALQLRADVNQ
jgi:hypothetical protein